MIESPFAGGVCALVVSARRALWRTPEGELRGAPPGLAAPIAKVLAIARELAAGPATRTPPELSPYLTIISIVTSQGIVATVWDDDELWRTGGRHLDLYRAALALRHALRAVEA